MSILYIGQRYEQEQEEYLMNICKTGISVAHHKFQYNITTGLEENGMELEFLTTLPVGNFPFKCKQLVFNSKKYENKVEIGFINIPIIKHIIRQFKIQKEIKKWCITNKEKKRIIIVYDIYLPFFKAVCKKKDYLIIAIIPDLPGKLCIEYDNYNWLTKLYKRREAQNFQELIYQMDGLIVLAKAMIDKLNYKKSNFIVVEAITEIESKEVPVFEKKELCRVFYAGELSPNVGIKALIDAFLLLDEKKYELVICGNGILASYIEDIAKNKHNVIYLGFLGKEALQKVEETIDIYINPRQNIDEFVKYSFPSKNIEYLKKGKPVIAYKLEGIPNEYDEYFYYPKDNSVYSLKEKIEEINKMECLELALRGKAQMEFIYNNKDIQNQGKRIKNFIKDLLDGN